MRIKLTEEQLKTLLEEGRKKKRKKRKSKGVGWPYGGYIGTIGPNDSDGGGDGGGGE